uniref:RING-type E3 ubiquitin transferase n=1 Tax=Davidia involucrata TaxID=16924 RepID=A0A5B6Z7E8_DAVIN
MTHSGLAGQERELEVSGGRTVVVGVKLDSQSKELLTWALVKVAQAGDCVIALHVLGNNEIVDRDGKSSLLSIVKAFDSVLAVYEGFCNLKQVDLKLKICRGSSVRKILVREASSYLATEIIVGTARNHHTIRSSISVAKYCARKLPKDCSILAVNNGKVVFQREASPATNEGAKGIEDHRPNSLLSAFQRKFGNGDAKPTVTCDQGTCGNLELALVEAGSDCAESALKQKCSICSPDSVVSHNSSAPSVEESSSNGDEDNSMAIVPVQKLEAASSSISLLIRELPELRPGWPLLQRAVLSKQQSSDRSSGRQISVVQWALQLPSRHCLPVANSDQKESSGNGDEDQSSNLDGESGAIVPVGTETMRNTQQLADCFNTRN